jgi:hypothetical protein
MMQEEIGAGIPTEPLRPAVFDRFQTQELASKALRESTIEADEFLAAVLPNAQCSAILKLQLGWSSLGQPLVFFGKPYFFSFHSIVDEVKHLESAGRFRSGTKPSDGFSGSLVQFRHKHFLGGNVVAQNVAAELGSTKEFDKLFFKQGSPIKSMDAHLLAQMSFEQRLGAITHQLILGAFEQRAETHSKAGSIRLTGHWIVFDQFNGRNRYLAVSPHLPNEKLKQILALCVLEFPDLNLKLSQ